MATCLLANCTASPAPAAARRPAAPAPCARGRHRVCARAGGDGPTPSPRSNSSSSPASAPPPPPPTVDAAEARIEALEAGGLKGRRGGVKGRPIPIRGMQPSAQQQQQEQAATSERAAWKEGQLFPEGWERMDAFEKATELYMGRRGMLYWLEQLTWGASIALVAGYVLLRIVLPNLGVYQLPGDAGP